MSAPPPPPEPRSFPVERAWEPLHGAHWHRETAAHLLRRIGFAATPEAVRAALRGSPGDVVDRAFAPGQSLPEWQALEDFRRTRVERIRRIRETADPEKRRELRREIRRDDQDNFREFAMRWFRFARDPEHSAREKFVLFLQDVFVVEQRNVRHTPALVSLQKTLREGIHGDYPELCKKVSREPAMVRYLDLQRNTRRKPNENFARELFELFILGEGNYSETDIKQAARAFTGYRIRHPERSFIFRADQHDGGEKTVFGETGKWHGDDVIDLAFRQPAARTFLIRELLRFYLADTPPPTPYIEALGQRWADQGFRMRFLIDTLFTSNLFFHPAYRGNRVKSPVQFYLGMCQDLRLDVVPFRSRLLRAMDAMGQSFFNPPNVRGWLHGAHWINATTIDARRRLVDYLFGPLNEDNLNGNQQRALEAAREADRAAFRVTDDRLRQLMDTAPDAIADHLATYFISGPSREAYRPVLREQIRAGGDGAERLRHLRHAVIALLQSPAYNLC